MIQASTPKKVEFGFLWAHFEFPKFNCLDIFLRMYWNKVGSTTINLKSFDDNKVVTKNNFMH
jgi:hypothetical protein